MITLHANTHVSPCVGTPAAHCRKQFLAATAVTCAILTSVVALGGSPTSTSQLWATTSSRVANTNVGSTHGLWYVMLCLASRGVGTNLQGTREVHTYGDVAICVEHPSFIDNLGNFLPQFLDGCWQWPPPCGNHYISSTLEQRSNV